MSERAELLARGPWSAEQVEVSWREDPFEPGEERARAADHAIRELRERDSPSHDGIAARLAAWDAPDGLLRLELQPSRWALRLVGGDACDSLTALCVTRDSEGRWLAGRRAPWLSSWPGRWALGAGGAVDLGESPVQTLTRELDEEWSVAPERLAVEALIRLPSRLVMLVGQAWLPAGAEVHPDHEHDGYDWWPPDPAEWPGEAHDDLRRMAALLA